MWTAQRRVLGLFIVAALLPPEAMAAEISHDVAMSILLGIAALYFALTTLCMVLVCCACYFNHRPHIVKADGDDQELLIPKQQREKPVFPEVQVTTKPKEQKPSFPEESKDETPPSHQLPPSISVAGDKTSDSTQTQPKSAETSKPHAHLRPTPRDSPLLHAFVQQTPPAAYSPQTRDASPMVQHRGSPRLPRDSPYLQRPSSATSSTHGEAVQHKGHVITGHRESPRLPRDSPYLQQYLHETTIPGPKGIKKIPNLRSKSPWTKRKADGLVASPSTTSSFLSIDSPRGSPRVSTTDLSRSSVPPEIVFRGVTNPVYEPIEDEVGAPTVLSLNKELSSISDRWFDIGWRLKVPLKTLSTIRRIHKSNTEKCLMTMFEEWIKMETNPSWTTIVAMLETQMINETVLAKTIKTKYCPDESTKEENFYTMID